MRIVWSDTGRRTLKYHQMLAERARPRSDERALLTVLLLRGAQAPGELRARTDRLHAFADRGEVEACLQPDGRAARAPRPRARAPGRAARSTAGSICSARSTPGRPRSLRSRRSTVTSCSPRARRLGTSGSGSLQRRRHRLRRPPRSTSSPAAVRELAAAADRRPGRRSPGRSRSARNRTRHRLPGRGGCRRDRGWTCAGDGRGGPAPLSRPPLRGRRPHRLMRPVTTTAGPPCSRGTRSSTPPPRSCRPVAALAAPWSRVAGWWSLCMPAPRSATSTSGGTSRSSSTSCLHDPRMCGRGGGGRPGRPGVVRPRADPRARETTQRFYLLGRKPD